MVIKTKENFLEEYRKLCKKYNLVFGVSISEQLTIENLSFKETPVGEKYLEAQIELIKENLK